MRAASKRRSSRIGPAKSWPKQSGLFVALTVFVAVAVDGRAADQSLGAPAASMTEIIRTQFPYEKNSTPPAGESGQVGRKNLAEVAAPASTNAQSPGTASLRFKMEAEQPVVRMPGFNVNAQKYSDWEKRLDQIDRSIDREQLLTVPGKLDLMLNGDRILPPMIKFGEETAEKRARDASKRVQILEMQRSVGLGLLYATPEARKRLKADQKLLQELSAPRFDEEFTIHPWTRP
jgi:hypothetical protein